MKPISYFIIFCFTISFAGEDESYAQTEKQYADHEMLQFQLLNIQSLNDSIFDQSENLINGRLYHPEGTRSNHPYFIENEWKTGKIWLFDRAYDAEMLKYDISSDNLINVFRFDSSAFPVLLNKNLIKQFEIAGHHFRYIGEIAAQVPGKFRAGYYEVLYEGVTSLYLHHEKNKSLNKLTLEPEYPLKSNFYLKHDGKYYQINNKKSFLKSFNGKESEIGSYMKENDFKFSVKHYGSVVSILEYFDKQELK